MFRRNIGIAVYEPLSMVIWFPGVRRSANLEPLLQMYGGADEHYYTRHDVSDRGARRLSG